MADESAFHALVDEFVRGCPTCGDMLSPEDVSWVAARMLLRKSNALQAPASAEQKNYYAACLFVLFVSEYLIHSQPTILGTAAQEAVDELLTILAALHEGGSSIEDFVRTVAAVDRVGTARALLHSPSVVSALLNSQDMGVLQASMRAIHTVDEHTVYSTAPDEVPEDSGTSSRSMLEPDLALELQPMSPSAHVEESQTRGPARLADKQLPTRWPARPRLGGAAGVIAVVGIMVAILGMLPRVLQASGVRLFGRTEGRINTNSFLPLVAIGLTFEMLLLRTVGPPAVVH